MAELLGDRFVSAGNGWIDLANGAPSDYIPAEGQAPKEPGWKSFDAFKDVVPPRRQ